MDEDALKGLSSMSLFGGLTPEELARFAERLKVERFATGDYVVREGEPAKRMYVIRTGAVEVLKRIGEPPREQRLSGLVAGDCFGEMSLIDIQPRSASVRATEETDALSLSNADLLAICRWRPTAYALVVGNLAREISRRLRRSDALAAEFLRQSAIAP